MKSELTPRLMNVAQKAGNVNTLCDIGCDHAYLPIYLIKNNMINSAYACDVREGPLEAAAKNIKLFGLEKVITTVLSDGLKEVADKKFDCITICGMGGILISKILYDSLSCAYNAEKIILQPMTEVESLRKFLFDNGFTIYDEDVAKENERYYNILCVKKGEEREYDDFDLFFGKKIFEKKDAVIERYLKKNYDVLSKNLAAKKKASREKTDYLEYIVERLGELTQNL